MQKHNKITSVILAAAMIIGLVFPSLFIAENSEHKCSGVDCQICAQVNLSLKVFNNLVPKPENALALISVFWVMVLVLGVKNHTVKTNTLIDLKIKLSN